MINIYVINLDKDTTRLNNIKLDYDKLECKNNYNLLRVSAVLGKDLDFSKLNLSIRTRACFDEKRTTHESIDSLGVIGCYLSHVKCWNLVLNNSSNDYGIVCEDDVELNNNLCEKIPKLWNELVQKYKPRTPLILLLNAIDKFYNPNEDENEANGELQRVNGRFFGAGAYILNKNAAAVLLKYAFPIEVHVDSYIAFLSKLGIDNLHTYHYIHSNLLGFQNTESTLNHSSCDNCWLPNRLTVSDYKTCVIYTLLLIILILVIYIFK